MSIKNIIIISVVAVFCAGGGGYYLGHSNSVYAEKYAKMKYYEAKEMAARTEKALSGTVEFDEKYWPTF